MASLVQVVAPATEPLTLAEVMAHLRLDESSQEPAPGAPSVALALPATSGNVDNGAHRYRVTFVTADGETQGGIESAAVTVADKSVNGKVTLSAIPLGGSAVTARKIYRTAAGGSSYFLLTTLADNTTTTFTDNVADAALGVGAPASNTTSDPLLRMLIASARSACEIATNRALITQTFDMVLDGFPNWELELAKGPLQSVTSISYVDTDGVTQILAADQYLVDDDHEVGRITPAFGLVWPVTRCQAGAVRVRYVAGYGSAAAVPFDLKAWMLLCIGTLYANPESIVKSPGAGLVEMPTRFVDQLASAHCVRRFF